MRICVITQRDARPGIFVCGLEDKRGVKYAWWIHTLLTDELAAFELIMAALGGARNRGGIGGFHPWPMSTESQAYRMCSKMREWFDAYMEQQGESSRDTCS